MHVLPILWSEPPTEYDWQALRGAKEALGYEGAIQPARAVPGSPGRILVIGSTKPDWLCECAHVDTAASVALPEALGWCLGLNDYDEAMREEDLLGRWLGVNVTLKEEVDYDGPVG